MRFFSGIESLFEEEVVGLEGGMGGCGKAPILMVLRTVFAVDGMPLALPKADPALGISGVEDAPCGVGNAEGLEGVLNREAMGVVGKLLRGALDCGRGGSAPVGGSAAGRARTGRDMALCSVLIWSLFL